MKCKRCGCILVKGQTICSVCDMDNSDQINIFNTYPQHNIVQNNYEKEINDTSSYEEYSKEYDNERVIKTKVIENKNGSSNLLVILIMIIILVLSLYFLNKSGKINVDRRNSHTNNNYKMSATKEKITTSNTITTTTTSVITTKNANLTNNENIALFNKLQNNVLNNINKKAVVDCDDDCSYVYSYDTTKYDFKVTDYKSHYLIELKILSKDNSLENACLKENDLICTNEKISKKIYK